MKKVLQSTSLKRIFLGIDFMFAFSIPALCGLAIIPKDNTDPLLNFIFCVCLVLSVVFMALGNANNLPEDGKFFIPFINTTLFLAPLSIIILLEHKHAHPLILFIPYFLSSIFFAYLISKIKNLIFNCYSMVKVFFEIQSNLITISELRSEKPKATFKSIQGKMINYHLKEIWGLVEVGQQYHEFTTFFKNNFKDKDLPFNKKRFCQKVEETADDEVIKVSGRNVRGNPYVFRRGIVEFIITLYEGSLVGPAGFAKARKNCPFYEMDEMPESTAKEWLEGCEHFIIPIWLERQNQKKENLKKYNH